MDEPLHIKYRPQTLKDFVGNSIMVRSLEDTLSKKGKPHAYLFHGPSGCGKTSIARILANMLGASSRDFRELNSASYRGIDGIRELINKASLRPWNSEVVVYLLDEAHALTKDAQHALLKLLEEPPRHCFLALATTEPDKLLKTIRTRCAQFAVTSLGRRQIITRLEKIAKAETKRTVDPELIKEIARASAGSMRSALMMLDQVIDIEDLDEAIEAVHETMGEDRAVIDLCRALSQNQKWSTISGILAELQGEPESIRYAVLGYFNTVALRAKEPYDAMVVIKHFKNSVMYSGRAGLTHACYDAVEELLE